ncbi:type II secretion system protein GspM [Agrobacterium radiobacter]|uniref:Type II secretion system protein GspM n=1 Tax=Agrobacterium radiobacter TaxID=362 RepID=A0ABD5LT81_AGRRD
MSELLITLMNAPRAVQRSTAIGMLVFIVALITIATTLLASALFDRISRIEEMRTELFRLDQIIARRPPQLPVEKQQKEGGLLFIEGDSLPVIQARLQERVNAAASASGALVVSISGMQQVQIIGAAYVGVRADLEGSLGAFHDVIRQLETSEPPLIIRKASIRSTNAISQGKLSGPLQLAGQIVIYGAANPVADLKENR